MVALLFVILIPAVGMAQGEGSTTWVINTNPIIDMFTWYNAEVEIKVSDTGTMGISGSYYTFEVTASEPFSDTEISADNKYMNIYGFYRYYPSGAALKGFFFGGRAGVNLVTANTEATSAQNELYFEEADGTFYGVGIDIGYSWLLGKNENFYVSLGIGAIRLFGGDLDQDDYDINLTLPTIRLINVGIGF
jgi:hypothetical protein